MASVSTAEAVEGSDSGDDRATAVAGNVTTCADAGLGGTDVTAQLTLSITGENQYLTVTGVPEETELTGIVVKGGENYNRYVPGELGLPATAPWTDLHAPLVGAEDGNVPTISHWFACGIEVLSSSPPTSFVPSSSPPTSSVPSDSAPVSSDPVSSDPVSSPPSSPPPSGSTSPSVSQGRPLSSVPPSAPTTSPMPPAATSSSAPAPIAVPPSATPVASLGGALADTGVATWPMVGVGAGLIAGGWGLALVARRRRDASAQADS